MLKNNLYMALLASLFIAVFSSTSIARSEVEQQEESFSETPQELTGRVGDVPVFSHIYGADFMTEQERCEYLLKLDGMKTRQERDAFRAKHHEKIDLRRKQKGG
ncbi:conserved exported hypothetical protein [Candidatus Methylobacter favarea]|uniref:Secreted protein n=1 Tax=Candidatus Methylobacter favarea TaxID=2707345 RepID=A0A8S0WJH9_9GAMM|nr:hypothetical protein [Candidatus Methylobacter favarea]CAA9891334.1 conserved exported hypothetical protein [Candidatus Methylobacter favarea]